MEIIVFGSLTFEFHIYFPLLFGKLCPHQIILYYNQSFFFNYFELCRGMCSECVYVHVSAGALGGQRHWLLWS